MKFNSLDPLLEAFVKDPYSLETVQKIFKKLNNFLNSITKKYIDSDWKDDIDQVARIGLLKALKKYNRDCNSSFAKFAHIYISGEINHLLRDHTKLIRTPAQKKLFYFKVTRYIERHTIEHHVPPTMESIMLYMNCNDKHDIDNIRRYGISDTSTTYTLENFPNHQNSEYFNTLYVQNLLSSLNSFERGLIEDFYFFGMTQKEIAYKNRLSQAQVSKLLQKIVCKLRKNAA